MGGRDLDCRGLGGRGLGYWCLGYRNGDCSGLDCWDFGGRG